RLGVPALELCFADHLRDHDWLDAAIFGEVKHRALTGILGPRDERRLEPRPIETRGQRRHMKRRTADVQARDDPDDPDRMSCHSRRMMSFSPSGIAKTATLS